MNIFKDKTITDVSGILAAGISCGIKKDEKKDLCVIYSKYKAISAAVFTTNKMKAAPLIITMENIKNNNTQAVVINSGNANSCTGEDGLENARNMINTTANCLHLSPQEVLVASTGALAVQLPMDLLIPGIQKACSALSDNAGFDAAEAILSTDTCIKTIAVDFELKGKKVTMAGMVKGSTMIHPNMGTMLAIITTDAKISKYLLNKALKESISTSFNMISVDGDTSTNDMVIVLANGASGHDIIDSEDADYNTFFTALSFVNAELAKMIIKDGEGSTKFIEVYIENAKTQSDARIAARSVVSSNLIKCEMFGSVMVWSTIACVLGYSGIDINPKDFDIYIGNDNYETRIVKNSSEIKYDKASVKAILSGDFIKMRINLKNGENCATAWGCDLTYDYVKLNGYFT
jgi:glutamate N-acetyltransferase/amino-acid N-acetyltransferase